MRNKEEGRKKITRERERDKEREREKGGGPKKAKEKQRETQKNKQNARFQGKQGFPIINKERKTKQKHTKEKKKQ